MIEIPCKEGQNLLSTNELENFTDYTYPKRRNEWFAGRVAAKKATANIFNFNSNAFPLKDIEIKNRKDGRPFLKLPTATNTRLDISISHSKEYAIAMASKNICGIDIQATEATLERVEGRFCSSSELDLLENNYNNSKNILLTKLWAAKEAVKKAACISGTMLGFTELQLSDITKMRNISYFHFITNRAINSLPDNYVAKVSYFSNYAISSCIIKTIPPEIWEKKDA